MVIPHKASQQMKRPRVSHTTCAIPFRRVTTLDVLSVDHDFSNKLMNQCNIMLHVVQKHCISGVVYIARWWCHNFFIFTRKIGEMIHFDEHTFQMGGGKPTD